MRQGRWLIPFAVLTLAAAGLGSSGFVPEEAEAVRFSTNFDDGTLQGWGALPGSYVTSGRGHSGTRSLKMADDSTGGGLADCYRIFPASPRGRLELWMFIPTGNAAPFDILISDQAAWAATPNAVVSLRVMLDGKIQYFNDGKYRDFPSEARAAVNAWTNLVLSWDTSYDEYLLSVNGVEKGSADPAAFGPKIKQVVFRSSSAGAAPVHAYFDDVKLTADVKPKPRFFTNFDTGKLQGWKARDGSGVSDDRSVSGRYTLKVNDVLKTSGLADCAKSFADVAYGQAFFNLYLPSGNTGPIDIFFSDQAVWTASPNARFVVRIMPDGAVKHRSKGAYRDFPRKAKLVRDAWYRVRLTWDTRTNRMRLNLNEVDLGAGGSWKAGGAVKQLILRSGSAAAAKVVGYFDDVKVTAF